MSKRPQSPRKIEVPRTSLIFIVGLVLVIHEAVFRGDSAPRVELLITYLFMMGLPVAEIGDILRRKSIDESGSNTGEREGVES